MAGLDVFTISVASTLWGGTLSKVITGLVRIYHMEYMAQNLDLLYPLQQRLALI